MSGVAAAAASAVKSAAAKSAASSAVAPAVNGFFGAITMRRQFKNQKKLMALQNQYDIEAFNRENARQDWLMRNEDSLKRQSLENAGYSTADPNGTGVTKRLICSCIRLYSSLAFSIAWSICLHSASVLFSVALHKRSAVSA